MTKLRWRVSGRFVADLMLRHWGTKALAFVITVLLFVFTRDEVTRSFTVPLRVVSDPARVLMTPVPDTIRVAVRGPWARVNRLQDLDFTPAVLDLRGAAPGPLQIDPATVVMPSGVVMSGVVYDHVDLRFDPIIERTVAVEAAIFGEPAPDYRVAKVVATPATVVLRGGRSLVSAVERMRTASYELAGANSDVHVRLELADPPPGVTVVHQASDPLVADVTVSIEAIIQRVRYTVAVMRPPELFPWVGIPAQLEVELVGPAPRFRVLEAAGPDVPVTARAFRDDKEDKPEVVVEVQWAPQVPEEAREALSFRPAQRRFVVPQPGAEQATP